jgi:hypothetical protein
MARKLLNYCSIILERGWQSKSLMIKWERHLLTHFMLTFFSGKAVTN